MKIKTRVGNDNHFERCFGQASKSSAASSGFHRENSFYSPPQRCSGVDYRAGYSRSAHWRNACQARANTSRRCGDLMLMVLHCYWQHVVWWDSGRTNRTSSPQVAFMGRNHRDVHHSTILSGKSFFEDLNGTWGAVPRFVSWTAPEMAHVRSAPGFPSYRHR